MTNIYCIGNSHAVIVNRIIIRTICRIPLFAIEVVAADIASAGRDDEQAAAARGRRHGEQRGQGPRSAQRRRHRRGLQESEQVQSNPLNGSPDNGSIGLLAQVLAGPISVLSQ